MAALYLRPAAFDDIPALSALGRESFVAKFGAMYRPEDLAVFLEEAHSEAALAAEMRNPARLYCLAERDGALVGYCKLAFPSSLAEYTQAARPLEIKQLYTAPTAIGGGIGSALMDWAMGEARSRAADEVQLSVWSGNHGAQRFYARYGFIKTADIGFWVGQQRDEEFLFAVKL